MSLMQPGMLLSPPQEKQGCVRVWTFPGLTGEGFDEE